jgi:hypothetical protein
MAKLLIPTAAFVLIGASVFAYLYREHPVMLKVVAGSARVLSPPMNASIQIDGQVEPAARCFLMSSYFKGKPADSLVFWLPSSSSVDGREILIVDRANHNVGYPNSSNLNYHLLWNRFLFQSESGNLMVPFRSAKSFGRDPELVVNDHAVSFRMPDDANYFPGKRVEIVY